MFVPEEYPVKDHLTKQEIEDIRAIAGAISARRRVAAPDGMVEAILCNPREVFLLADLCLELQGNQITVSNA